MEIPPTLLIFENYSQISLPIDAKPTVGGNLVIRLKDSKCTELVVARHRASEVKKPLGL